MSARSVPSAVNGIADGAGRSYHGQAVIKEPVWSWEIPIYFFTGGMGGASAGLAYLAELRGNEVLAQRVWGVGLAGLAVSAPLLISDLGRPARFLNMLRMFKVTSPMSVGTWILSTSGPATGFAALNAWTGWFPRAGRAARPTAALAGLPLATYTAALIANTSVPVWHEARRELPFVFGAGAALSAAAGALITTPTAAAAPARRLALASAAVKLGAEHLMEKRLGEHAEPYEQLLPAQFKRISQLTVSTGAALLAIRGGRSRAAAVAAGTLMGAGALATRWSIFKAGFESARDPKYVVGPQRQAIERGERQGAARRTSRIANPDPRRGSPATSDHHQDDERSRRAAAESSS